MEGLCGSDSLVLLLPLVRYATELCEVEVKFRHWAAETGGILVVLYISDIH